MSDAITNGMNIEMPQARMPHLNTSSKEKLEKAAKEFEGMFMDIVMKSMRDTVPESDAFGDSKKINFFQSMLDSEYSKNMEGKIGLADAIVRQLMPQLKEAKQESQNPEGAKL